MQNAPQTDVENRCERHRFTVGNPIISQVFTAMTQRWTWTIGFLAASLCLTCSAGLSDTSVRPGPRRAVMFQEPTPWADSLIETLTLDQKIGQLFMIPAYSNKGKTHEDAVRKLIDNYEVGGVIFMQGTPVRQVELLNDYQTRSQVPMLIAMDAEWGPAMRLDSTVQFPRQMTLGAAASPSLAYAYGRECARQLRQVGVHVNFAPVLDVNNNPENPVINSRAFGENREMVTLLGGEYSNGLQDGGVLACAKHFPGHGDTDVDSHEELPFIMHDVSRLDSIELYPFRNVISTGIGSMMIAHLFVPSLDSSERKPSTLSNKIVDGLLRDSLGFEGLIFTDAMTMKGIAKYFEPGEMHVRALEAGNDVLLFPGEVKVALERIKQAVADSVLSEELITERCHRVLKTKEWCGISTFDSLSTRNLTLNLTNEHAQALEARVASEALTVIKNADELLPLRPDSVSIATITIGGKRSNAFTTTLDWHVNADHYAMSAKPDFGTMKSMREKLGRYDVVLAVTVATGNHPSNNYRVGQDPIRMLQGLEDSVKVVYALCANPYALSKLRDWENFESIIVGYQDSDATLAAMAELMIGAAGTKAKLPVGISRRYPEGTGIDIQPTGRLSKGYGVDFGLDAGALGQIDNIVYAGLDSMAFPGCRVLVAKSGKVIWDKAYGYQTYEKAQAITRETVYDLASITKVAASTTALMQLVDEGKVSVDYNLCDYIEIPDTNDHFNMNLREMLSHTARLKPWIPFYYQTLANGNPDRSLYRSAKQEGFSTEVAEGVWIMDSYVDSMRQTILDNGLRNDRDYRYSDLGYYFVKEIIEDESGLPLDTLMYECFYDPLGLKSMCFKPRDRMGKDVIAPTEKDGYFRDQLIHGYVHDPGAAMLGGIGGHAGLFSNAWDLGVLMQMFMDGGTYAGQRFLEEETVEEFTSCQFCDEDNRRGIGFDKPTLSLNAGPTCNQASASSFGHSGFTGTLAWADPEHEIVYVFLSNRVYPDAANKRLLQMDIRTRIQETVYEAFGIPDRAERRPSR